MLRRMLRTREIEARRVGRANRYRLSDFSRSTGSAAARKLFGGPLPEWDGRWTLALYQFQARERGMREHVRVVLALQGFGSLARGTFLHPHDRVEAVTRSLSALGLEDRVRLFRAERAAGPSDPETAARAWDLREIADGYRRLGRQLRSLRPGELSPRASFVAGNALASGFLAVAFRDPELPAALLPQAWPGPATRAWVSETLAGLRQGMLAHAVALGAGRRDRWTP
jgi:phenylacetic acid degradation operon negative regulatory protein